MEETKCLCDMCLRKKVNCGVMKFRRLPWIPCRHYLEDEHDDLECDGDACTL